MNAEDLWTTMLVCHATLKSRWKPRFVGTPKREYILTFPDGTVKKVQYANVEACLKFGSIRIKAVWSGGICDYEAVPQMPKVLRDKP